MLIGFRTHRASRFIVTVSLVLVAVQRQAAVIANVITADQTTLCSPEDVHQAMR